MSNIDYKQKYLEYKIKYFNKKYLQYGGSNITIRDVRKAVKDVKVKQVLRDTYNVISHLVEQIEDESGSTHTNNPILQLASNIMNASEYYYKRDSALRIAKLSNDPELYNTSILHAMLLAFYINNPKDTNRLFQRVPSSQSLKQKQSVGSDTGAGADTGTKPKTHAAATAKPFVMEAQVVSTGTKPKTHAAAAAIVSAKLDTRAASFMEAQVVSPCNTSSCEGDDRSRLDWTQLDKFQQTEPLQARVKKIEPLQARVKKTGSQLDIPKDVLLHLAPIKKKEIITLYTDALQHYITTRMPESDAINEAEQDVTLRYSSSSISIPEIKKLHRWLKATNQLPFLSESQKPSSPKSQKPSLPKSADSVSDIAKIGIVNRLISDAESSGDGIDTIIYTNPKNGELIDIEKSKLTDPTKKQLLANDLYKVQWYNEFIKSRLTK